MLLFCMIIRVSCNVHQRHHDHAEDAADQKPYQESDHIAPPLFIKFIHELEMIVNKYLYSIIPIYHYKYTFMLYNTIYSAPISG